MKSLHVHRGTAAGPSDPRVQARTSETVAPGPIRTVRYALRSRATVVGRAAETALIERLLQEAREGRSKALLISGEPGVGKSELLRYALERAEGMRVLRVRGVESESELPFSALSDLLRPVLFRLEAIPPPQSAALAGALALGPPAAPDRFAVYAAAFSLLVAAAEDGPLLAVVDDAHWLDPSSREALLFSARRLEAEGIVLLFALREGEGEAFERAGIDEVRVGGLELDAARELLAREADRGLPAALAHRLHEETGGNPLALIEIGSLLRAGELRPEELAAGLPTLSAEEAFRRRLAGLSPPGRRALLVAALSHSPALEVLETAFSELGLEPDVLAEVEAARLVRARDTRLEFRHPLVRSAVVHGASLSEQRDAHRALAAAFAVRGDEDERAWHLAGAVTGPDQEAASALAEAAVRARARAAYAEAARAFQRAAELTQGPEERAQRLLEAARDWELTFVADGAFRALTMLENLLPLASDPLLRADVQHLRGRLLMWQGSPRRAHELLLAEAERVEEADPARAAVMFTDATHTAAMSGDVALAVATAARAHDAGKRVGGVPEIVAGAVLGAALLLQPDVAAARPLILRMDDVFAERDSPLDAARVHPVLLTALPIHGYSLIWLEEYERARKFLNPLVEAGRMMSAPAVLVLALYFRSILHTLFGRWTEARVDASEALALARDTGQENARAYALVYLARLDAAQGRETECREHCREGREIADRVGSPSLVSYVGAALGLLELGIGRIEEAVPHLDEAEAICAAGLMRHPAVTYHGPDLVEALLRADRREEAETTFQEFDRQAQATRHRWALATAARCRGLLARDDEFERAFAEALAHHEREPSAFDRARTELCYGERLRRARRRAEARERLRSALETFERLGAGSWAERARSELRATGETVRARAGGGLEQLTPQELQVALHVARGATNREVAASLFLSPKTIEAHLHRIYMKLGVRSRTELAHFLAREGVAGGVTGAPAVA